MSQELMSGLIINDREVPVEGVQIITYRDDPRLALRVGSPSGSNDGRTRAANAWVRLVVIHTTKGIPGGTDQRPQDIRPGLGPATEAGARTARFWSTDPKSSGAHLVVDHDGVVTQLADLQLVAAYHAGHTLVNNDSIGIEMYQGAGAELYRGQLDVTAKVVDAITREFGIQRQVPDRYRGALERFDLRDAVGVVGHRDVSDNRGLGDPGDAVFEVLATRGYERFDFAGRGDITVWRQRQRELGVVPDGIAGPKTRDALALRGFRDGIWTTGQIGAGPADDRTLAVTKALDALLPAWVALLGSEDTVRTEVEAWARRR
jgi:hypothetical protein